MKGLYMGNCNRTACQRSGATWFNHAMALSRSDKKTAPAYYCQHCARLINQYNSKVTILHNGKDFETEFCVSIDNETHPYFSGMSVKININLKNKSSSNLLDMNNLVPLFPSSLFNK